MSIDSWLFFMAVWIAASVPLGPNALNCIGTSAAHGFRKGLWSVAGVFAAANIHMALALSGIAAFMSTNPVLFDILRWFGVAYLIWMGISMIRSKADTKVTAVDTGFVRRLAFRRAVFISLSNPKAIFAWLAIFSQFVQSDAPLTAQLVVLAPSALSVTILVYVGYCALGPGVNWLFRGNRKRWFDRIAGTTYLVFAAGLASGDLRRA